MSIIKNYKRFLTESLDPSIKSLEDVPEEVIQTAKRIANDFFDRVRKPIFELDSNKGLIFRFEITEQDFLMIDEEEDLTLDLNQTARGKRSNDVTLVFDDKISETYQVTYIVNFDAKSEHILDDENLEDDDDDEDFIDDYELNKNEFNHDFDEDEIDNHIVKKIKKNNIDFEDNLNDDDDDDDDYGLREDFNPFKKKDWEKASSSIKRGIGILSKEEAIQKGLQIVRKHKTKSMVYESWLEKDSNVAEKFLEYVGKNPDVKFPRWNGERWIDSGEYFDGSGILGGK